MIYKELIPAKNSHIIPIFNDGKPMHSKYDPEREADAFVSTIEHSDFFVVIGIGGAYHIKKLSEKYTNSIILAVDNSQEDIEYIKENILCTKETETKQNVFYSSICDFQQKLLELYIPAIRTSISVVDHKAWCTSNPLVKKNIMEIFTETLSRISSDFSTQAFFGKIWTRNILQNLKYADYCSEMSFPVSKTALITGAGPTLEHQIEKIHQNRKDFYIISTDTSYKILSRSGISPDAVFSVDGQNVSSNHFSEINGSSLFIFELTANHSCVKKVIQEHKKLVFTVSYHPLEMLAYKFHKDSFIQNDSSSGTVTIAAVDFAKKVGFEKIMISGADFAYVDGKSYAKGSYLDDIYAVQQTRTETHENLFSRLMFRTPLIELSEKKFTTNTLQSYKNALEKWLVDNNFTASKENNCYHITANTTFKTENFSITPFPFESFITEFKTLLCKNGLSVNDEITVSLLPLISFFKKKDLVAKNEINSFDSYLKLARSYILRYT